jgi:hypothetical protein
VLRALHGGDDDDFGAVFIVGGLHARALERLGTDISRA